MSEGNNNSKKKILVVEDEKYLRELYVEMLEEEGYLVDSKDIATNITKLNNKLNQFFND